MAGSGDITVLTVFHNRAVGVDISLQSLRDQHCQDYRVVALDDGSSDDTLERLRAWQSDRIVVRTQNNAGFTPAMISLCAEARSEFIAVHGSGDESLPNRLAVQRAFLQAHPNIVAVGCGIENIDEISGRRWNVVPRQEIRTGPITGDFGISHGEVMFRREAYLATGGYRAAFPVGQATDLFRRMSRLGDFGYPADILYRRYLRLDGVSAKIEKIAERDVLAALSTAVHRRAIAQGSGPQSGRLRDELDRYGLLLPYFAEPHRDIATNLARAAVKLWVAGNRPLALRLARRSLAEYRTGQGIASYVAILAGIGPLKAPLARLVAGASGGADEISIARFDKR